MIDLRLRSRSQSVPTPSGYCRVHLSIKSLPLDEDPTLPRYGTDCDSPELFKVSENFPAVFYLLSSIATRDETAHLPLSFRGAADP